jgi:hypothetical protein
LRLLAQQVTFDLKRADDRGVVEIELAGVAVDQIVEVVAEMQELGGWCHVSCELAKVPVLLGLSFQRVFPLAPAGLRPPVYEDRATHCWLDLAADASAHPEGRDWVAGPTLDLLVMLSVLAEHGPVAEDFVGEVLFLEGWHLVGEKLDECREAPDDEKPHNGF